MTSMNEFFHYKKNHNEYIHTNFESLGRPSQDQMYNQPNRVDKELAKTNTENYFQEKTCNRAFISCFIDNEILL